MVLQMGASLPAVCVVCGNPAAGIVVHERFGPPDLWWVLPPLIDFIKLRNALDFRFLFAYSAGGRGNGKRVARRLHCRLGSLESVAAR
jgi:hypothetical protein